MTKKMNKEINSWLLKKNPDYRKGVQLYYKFQPGKVKIFPKEPTGHHLMRLRIALQALRHQVKAPERGTVKEEKEQKEKKELTPKEKLMAINLASEEEFDYYEGLAIATDLELELKNREKATVLEALREAKSKLDSDE